MSSHTSNKMKGMKTKIIVGIVIAVSGILVWRYFSSSSASEAEVVKADRAITVASVATLSQISTPLPLLGTVSSKSEADVRAESSGRLVAVYKKLGDYVRAGEVIAEFDNSAERAGVVQAQGAYDAAKAGQGIASISTNIAEINTGLSVTSLTNAKTQAQNTIKTVYVTLDDAVRTKTDGQFSNPQTREAKFVVSVSDAKLVIALEAEHQNIESLLSTRERRNRTFTENDDLVAELNTIENEANTVKTYLDDLSLALNHAIPDNSASQSTIEGYKTSTGLARAAVGGSLSVIAISRTALNASISASKVAQKSLELSNTGSTASTEASLKSALGLLQAAEARLESTIIRSPISGTINSISVHTGDFIPPFGEVAVVSNNGALEVVSYTTLEDAIVLKVGGKVTIEGSVPGVITSIAHAIDPKTKKIEIRIGILGSQSALINGQSVRIEAMRARVVATNKNKNIQIPLSALKITPLGARVFTVSASSTLVAHPVKEGKLLGDQIEIVEGLTPEMEIVIDARGLKEGQAITLSK